MSAMVAVLVVNYASTALIEENLAQTAVPDGTIIVVVDNATTPAERDRARDAAERHGWYLVEPETNLGFGDGMNAAAARARDLGAEVFVLLNPDAHLVGDGVARLVAHVAADPGVMVAPLVIRPDGGHFSSLMEVDLATGSMRRVRGEERYARSELWLSGACFAIGHELWERVGGFDHDYFLYWEDVDFSVRVARAGGRLLVDDSIVAVHEEGGTQDPSADHVKSPTYYYFNVRNRLVFAAQHLDKADRRRWAQSIIPGAWQILLRGGRRQLLRPTRNVLPAVRGTMAGLAYMRTHRES